METNKIIVFKEGTGKNANIYFIEKNRIYTVGNKRDADAPDGFQQLGTTKLPDPDIGVKMCNLAVADPDKHTKSRPHYDTFMTEHSRRVNRMFPDKSERDAHLKNVRELILEPVEEIYGREGILSPTNREFWDSEDGRKDIFNKEIFNTSDPIDFMHLYMLIMNRELAPENYQSRPTYNLAQFTVVDYEDNVDIKQKQEFSKNQAISRMMTTGSTNLTQLTTLLDYMGVYSASKGEKLEDISFVFTDWIDQEVQNARLFNTTYEELMTSKSGAEILETFSVVKGLVETKDIALRFGQYYFQDEEVGTSLREVTSNIVGDKALKKQILEIVTNK